LEVGKVTGPEVLSLRVVELDHRNNAVRLKLLDAHLKTTDLSFRARISMCEKHSSLKATPHQRGIPAES